MARLSQRILSYVVSTTAITAAASSNCKCTPDQSCWPSAADWSSLNSTLSGTLIQSLPPASVCYPSQPNYNEDACTLVRDSWFNSTFHADDPISIDYPVRIDNPCSPIWPNGTSVTGDPTAGAKGCQLGELPSYVVDATSAEHISEALKWAGDRNIRAIVKNTGHSYSARSSGYGALSIWTHHLRGIEYLESFQPTSCPTNGTFKAARLAAGETGGAVTEALAPHNAVVVTGANPDVGLMGWMSGGGHGYLSREYGMGADNLLEATVILPNGSVITTNPCQSPSIFYAIRGGGSGTFGVLLSAVVRAYSSPQTTNHVFAVQALSANVTPEFYQLVGFISGELQRLKEGGMQGYYYILGPPAQPSLTLFWAFFLYNKPNGTVESLMAPIEAKLNEPGVASLFGYVSNVTSAPSYWDVFQTHTNENVASGGSAYASWLLSPEAFADVNKTASVFQQIGPSGPGEKVNGAVMNPILLGHLIASPNNASYYPDISSLNPAWRETLAHFITVETWPDYLTTSSPDIVEQVYKDLTTKNALLTTHQSSTGVRTGAYFNEADYNQPDWQSAFFGSNYDALKAIKDELDPNGVFWCRQCVGSEEWVEDGKEALCRAGY